MLLNRKSIRAGVAATAVLCSFALSNDVLGAWAPGNVITHSENSWGDPPNEENAATLLHDHYFTVYPTSISEVGLSGTAGFSMRFSNPGDLLIYLPNIMPEVAPLTTDHANPTSTESGEFGAEVMALRLNIDFSDAGLTLGNLGIPFGELELHSFTALPLLNGLTMRQLSAEVNSLLGGGPGIYTPAQLLPVTEDLNRSFSNGAVTEVAQDHLRLPPSTNGDFITYPQTSWGQSPTGTNAAGLLADNYDSVYAGAGGVFFVGRGGIGDSMRFTSATNLLNYLPQSGTGGTLSSDYVNPLSTSAGEFGGEVAALKLNIDYADAGLLGDLGIPFGDLELYGLTDTNQTQFNGQTVRTFFNSANFVIGNPVVVDVRHFNAITEQLNSAFGHGYISSWAQDHLRIPGITGDYNDNGIIDAADYVVWRKNGGGPLSYDAWRSNFGSPAAGGSAVQAATGEPPVTTVPEPGAAGLALVGLLALPWRGNRWSNPC